MSLKRVLIATAALATALLLATAALFWHGPGTGHIW